MEDDVDTEAVLEKVGGASSSGGGRCRLNVTAEERPGGVAKTSMRVASSVAAFFGFGVK